LKIIYYIYIYIYIYMNNKIEYDKEWKFILKKTIIGNVVMDITDALQSILDNFKKDPDNDIYDKVYKFKKKMLE